MPPLVIACYTTNSWLSPLAHLRILGPARHAGLNVLHGNERTQFDFQAISQADFVIIQRDFPRYNHAYRRIVEQARAESKPIIYELDDLLFDLPPQHPDYRSHYYDAALLPMLQAVLEADAVTASSLPLKNYLSQFNPNVYLLPNYLDDSVWTLRLPSPPVREQSPIVIGYMGGDSHAPDVEMVLPALLKVATRFASSVEFHFVGQYPPPALASLPNVRWSPIKTMDYAAFAADFLHQDFDIVIAPLGETRFNRCKSAIKFLEYTALGVPGVYSQLEPYTSVVANGQTGFLAATLDDWESHLNRLVEDPNLRYEMACRAQGEVQANWLLSAHAREWQKAYEEVITHPPRVGLLPEDTLRIVRQAVEWQHNQQARLETFMAQQAEQDHQRLQGEQALARLGEIEHSTAWKLVRRFWGMRLALFPKGSRRERLAHRLAKLARTHPRGGATSRSDITPTAEIGGTTISLGDSDLQFIPPTLEETLSFWPKRLDLPDVIVFPVMDWASRRQRPQQIALQFARNGHRVFYLHTWFRPDAQPSAHWVHPNIVEVQMPAPKAVNLYQETMNDAVLRACEGAFVALQRQFQIADAICMVDLPFWTPLASRLRQRYGWKIIYDCMDEHQGFATNTAAMWQGEEILARQSDLVLVSSRRLQTKMAVLNPHYHLVPNGADFDHFQQPAAPPAEMSRIEHPIIGYYGAIADWFDSLLVRELASARPGWNFVLIGDTRYADLDALGQLSNIYLLGEKPYAELPAYLQAFDVAIIPFKKLPLTEATNPVKLFEYLSAGKPVVATDLDELRYYSQYVRLAEGTSAWLTVLDQALADRSPSRIQERLDFARQNTWEQRYLQIASAVAELFLPRS